MTSDPDFLTLTFEAYLEQQGVYKRLKGRLELRQAILSKRKGATWYNETFEEKMQRSSRANYEDQRNDRELDEYHMEYQDEMSRRRMEKQAEDARKRMETSGASGGTGGTASTNRSWFPTPEDREETDIEREMKRLAHISEFGH